MLRRTFGEWFAYYRHLLACACILSAIWISITLWRRCFCPYQVKVKSFVNRHKKHDLEYAIRSLYKSKTSKDLAGFKQMSVCLGNASEYYFWISFDSKEALEECKKHCENMTLLSSTSSKWTTIRRFQRPVIRSTCLFVDQKTRLRLLFSDPPYALLQRQCRPQDEKEVYMLRLANFIVTQTDMFICNCTRCSWRRFRPSSRFADGGYIRDYILRGDLHDEVVRALKCTNATCE